MHPDVLDIPAAAELLALSERMAYQAARSGEVPAWRLGKQWRLWRPAVLRAVGGDAAAADHPMRPAGDPEIVDRATLAELLGITPHTCGALLKDGTIPSGRVGSSDRIYWPAVRQLMIDGHSH